VYLANGMNTFESFEVFHISVNLLKELNGTCPCTDHFLVWFVDFGLITDEDRYKVFSYPSTTVFYSIHRYLRLFELIRDYRCWVRFFRILLHISIELEGTAIAAGISKFLSSLKTHLLLKPSLKHLVFEIV